MPEFAGGFRAVGGLLVIGAGVRIISNTLKRSKLKLPRVNQFKTRSFKIKQMKLKPFKMRTRKK